MMYLGLSLALVSILVLIGIILKAGRGRLPYEKKRFLFSKAERAFYDVLCLAVPADYVIFAKVRLIDVIDVKPGIRDRAKYTGPIVAKHLDFVICDRKWLEPRLAIELDDSSHNRPDRQRRDAFVDRAAESAGLPLVRVPVRSGYQVRALQVSIMGHLARDAETRSRA